MRFLHCFLIAFWSVSGFVYGLQAITATSTTVTVIFTGLMILSVIRIVANLKLVGAL